MSCKNRTRKRTRNAQFQHDFGRFLLHFLKLAYTKEARHKTGLQHCSLVQLRGFRNNVGAKL